MRGFRSFLFKQKSGSSNDMTASVPEDTIEFIDVGEFSGSNVSSDSGDRSFEIDWIDSTPNNSVPLPQRKVCSSSDFQDESSSKRIGFFARHRQARLDVLEGQLFSARMQIKAEMLYSYAVLSGLLAGAATFVLLAYLSQLLIPLSFFVVFPILGLLIVLVWLSIALASVYGAYTAILYLPVVEGNSRRMRIDLSMFNVATYLYALHHSEPNLYVVISSLAKYSDYYGEAARELRQVVFDCEMTASDLYTALLRLSETTPSDKFRFFLTGLSSSYKTIGTANDYLRMKVNELRNEQRISQKVYLNTLGVIAEMYITIFVAGPLFIIIVVMVMGMISSANPLILAVIIYVMLPFGTAIFLLMLNVISEVHEDKSEEIHMKKASLAREGEHFSSIPVVMPSASESPAFARLAKRDSQEKYRVFTDSPIEYMKIHPEAVLLFSVPAALVVTGILYFLFVSVPLTPWTFIDWVTATEDIVMVGVLTMLIPFSVFYAVKSRKTRRIEEAIPDFADQMASAVRHNMTLGRAVELIATEGKSNILEEINLIRRDIYWGALATDAIRRFSENVRVGSIDRMTILIYSHGGENGDVLRVTTECTELYGASRNFWTFYRVYMMILLISAPGK